MRQNTLEFKSPNARQWLRRAAAVLTWLGAAAWLGSGAGCAGVPDAAVVEHGNYDVRAAQLRNAWGPISERAKAAVLGDLKRKAGDLDILDRQIALEQAVAGAPLVLGNQVAALVDGPQTYAAMFRAMREAKRSINFETYIIRDDEVGREFAEIVLERAAAGVKVNVIYDSFGCIGTPREYFERLRRGGVQVVEFNPVNPAVAKMDWSPNHRDHRKLTIVDGRTVFLGGINIDRVYAQSSEEVGRGAPGGSSGSGSARSGSGDQKRGGWRDTDVQIDGPVVADFQRMFLQTWEKQKGPRLEPEEYLPRVAPVGKDVVRAIGSSPDDAASAIYLAFLAAVTHAEKQAYITNAYFVPDPQLVEALLKAAQRGVDVRLILPSTTDARAAAHAARSHYETLLRGGVKIYERDGALLHAKTAVIDGVWSTVGSANLDWRSAVDNDEVTAVVLSREFGQRMLEVFAYDQARSQEIKLEEWRRRAWRQRMKECFFRMFGRLL